MKVMVIGKATKDSEAGVMAPEEKWREMGEFNEALTARPRSSLSAIPFSAGTVRNEFPDADTTVRAQVAGDTQDRFIASPRVSIEHKEKRDESRASRVGDRESSEAECLGPRALGPRARAKVFALLLALEPRPSSSLGTAELV